MSDNILVFPGGEPAEAEEPGEVFVNAAAVKMLEDFLGLAKEGKIISVGISAVNAYGDALENFAMSGLHALGFLGSVVLMEALVRQRILQQMSMSAPIAEVRKELDDRRDSDPFPDASGPADTDPEPGA